MPKYETTLKIRARERVPDLRSILEGLYYRKPQLAKKAEKFIDTLVERKRLPAEEWEAMQHELGSSHGEYYTMLAKLRDAGMISKKDGSWIVSEQFANRCHEMGDIWNAFVRRWRADGGRA
jgi:hypothetical protein